MTLTAHDWSDPVQHCSCLDEAARSLPWADRWKRCAQRLWRRVHQHEAGRLPPARLAEIEVRIKERREAANNARIGNEARALALDSDTDMMHELVTALRGVTIARDALQEVVREMGQRARGRP